MINRIVRSVISALALVVVLPMIANAQGGGDPNAYTNVRDAYRAEGGIVTPFSQGSDSVDAIDDQGNGAIGTLWTNGPFNLVNAWVSNGDLFNGQACVGGPGNLCSQIADDFEVVGGTFRLTEARACFLTGATVAEMWILPDTGGNPALPTAPLYGQVGPRPHAAPAAILANGFNDSGGRCVTGFGRPGLPFCLDSPFSAAPYDRLARSGSRRW